MKALSIIILSFLHFLSLPSSLAGEASQVPNLSDSLIRMNYQRIQIPCFEVPEDTYVINSQEELAKVFHKRTWEAECKEAPLPEIDFEFYTLLGFVRGSSGCYESKLRMAIRKNEAEKSILLSARINYTGDCMMYTYYIRWCLVKKVPEDYEVNFYLF